jgi:Trp operon repressor
MEEDEIPFRLRPENAHITRGMANIVAMAPELQEMIAKHLPEPWWRRLIRWIFRR